MPTAPTTPDNKTNLQAAAARWIKEAANRFDGAAGLDARAVWAEKQLRKLSAAARQDCYPEHLQGLTASDLISLAADLRSAAEAHRVEGRRQVAEARAQARAA